jgi:hypothetical protein
MDLITCVVFFEVIYIFRAYVQENVSTILIKVNSIVKFTYSFHFNRYTT